MELNRYKCIYVVVHGKTTDNTLVGIVPGTYTSIYIRVYIRDILFVCLAYVIRAVRSHACGFFLFAFFKY